VTKTSTMGRIRTMKKITSMERPITMTKTKTRDEEYQNNGRIMTMRKPKQITKP